MTFDQLQKVWSEKFREKFGDNVAWWGEMLAEMHQGDPDFKGLILFLSEMATAFYEAGANNESNGQTRAEDRAQFYKAGFEAALKKVREAIEEQPTFIADMEYLPDAKPKWEYAINPNELLAAITKIEEEHKTRRH